MSEQVNHPSHYGGDVPHEVIKCLKAWGIEADALLWNAVKYISRAGKKNPAKTIEDLKKAQFYLNRRIADLEKEVTILPKKLSKEECGTSKAASLSRS